MLRICFAFALAVCLPGQAYFPGALDDWQQKSPEAAGFDKARLESAIAFARSSESTTPRDLRLAHDLSFGREMYGEPLGPFRPRGEMTGIIVRNGYVVAEWGEPDRVDMTFSVTKSFLSTVVGLAVDDKRIGKVSDRVYRYVPEPEFEGPLNSRITWDHLLRQTSDWEGSLWGKPDWADRPPAGKEVLAYRARKHNEPGTSWKYNDVRVNLLALAALHVWRKPLPAVLRERIMDPIGASNTWRWHGYENSWVDLDGQKIQSVSGGGHWGGGLFLHARDQARFGLLTVRNGNWNGKQLLSAEWIRMARTPTPVEPAYGFMNWYLNTGRKRWPSAPEHVFAHVGNGANLILCDTERDMVIVLRWIDNSAVDAFLGKLYAAVTK